MNKWYVPSGACLICGGEQEVVIGIRERGPRERQHSCTRVLFCAACDIGELRTCPAPRDHQRECAQHLRACDTSVRADRTKPAEYGPGRHSPAGRTTVMVKLTDGLAEFC